ncbi:L-threonylcarbamoyladenylate synthase [Motiliproteus sediminis]|uniref:L-threonylcarbamoyladenylate synthase n=1 Tax=Motiliproteus sediminis TaxID=1468178 RepID=UPI001AEF9250
MDRWRLRQAVRALGAGGVIAYPTEAVWGLGCDPWQRAAVERLLLLKSRPQHKGLILVASDIEQLAPLLAGLSAAERDQLAATWPGPNTWLLPDPQGWVPEWVKGQHASVAVRVSAHPLVRSLCRAFGAPLVSTSANPAGQEPARSAGDVRQMFPRQLDYLLPGPLGGLDKPTVIRDLRSGSLLRS